MTHEERNQITRGCWYSFGRAVEVGYIWPSRGEGIWKRLVALVRSRPADRTWVYKQRRLRAAELVEISESLEISRTLGSRVANVVDWAIDGHDLRMLTEFVPGIPLRHSHHRHGGVWRNDSLFSSFLSARDGLTRDGWCRDVRQLTQSAHAAGILLPDLCLDQFVSSTTGRLVYVDVDGLTLENGWGSRQQLWHHAHCPDAGPPSRESDLLRTRAVCDEIRTASHLDADAARLLKVAR